MQHPIPLDTNVQITPVEIASSAIGVRLSAFGREALAMLFWVYVILKLFVYDFDAYLVTEYFPEEVWLLKFRLVILIGVIAVALLIFGKNRVGAWSLYIIAYPLIITFWKLPYFIYNRESWTLAFAIINSVLSFYRSLRYNVAVSAVCLTSLVIIFLPLIRPSCGLLPPCCLACCSLLISTVLSSSLGPQVYSNFIQRRSR
jgi:hypothetical protein